MSDDVPSRISPFEQIRQLAEDGSEYWSARDLAEVLGYTNCVQMAEYQRKQILSLGTTGNAAE